VIARGESNGTAQAPGRGFGIIILYIYLSIVVFSD